MDIPDLDAGMEEHALSQKPLQSQKSNIWSESQEASHSQSQQNSVARVEPLLRPLEAADFHETGRLESLLLPNEDDCADIRLVDGHKLLSYIHNGGKMVRRQVLEERNSELFCGEKLVQSLLQDMEKGKRIVHVEDKRFLGEKTLLFFPGIVAISYAWVDPLDPDPDREQLFALVPVLEWFLSERALLLKRSTEDKFRNCPRIDADDAPAEVSFGVFIDFMCIFQPDEAGLRTASESASFQRALYNIGLLYGHEMTMLFKITHRIPGSPEDRVWGQRGWCNLEGRLADLVSRSQYSLDISNWHSRPQIGHASPSGAFGTVSGPAKTLDELAVQGDCFYAKVAPTLKALNSLGRRPPLSPEDFRSELTRKVFGFPSDAEVCAEIYEHAAVPLLTEKTAVDFEGLAFPLEAWGHLGGSLNCTPNLVRLLLPNMKLAPDTAALLFDKLRQSALPALRHLVLSPSNKIGDRGCTALAAALRRESMPSLQRLNLAKCSIGSEGAAALISTAGDGHLQELTNLDLSMNALESPFLFAVAALPAGALPSLALLDFRTSQHFSTSASAAFADVLARRALPALSEAKVDGDELAAAAIHAAMTSRDASRPEVLRLKDAADRERWASRWDGLGLSAEPERDVAESRIQSRCEDAIALLQELEAREFEWLQRLALSSSRIGDAGCCALAKALERNAMERLSELELRQCGFRELGVRALVSVGEQGVFSRLSVLRVDDNPLGDAGVETLCSAAAGSLSALRLLGLERCGVGEAGCEALIRRLQSQDLLVGLTQAEDAARGGHLALAGNDSISPESLGRLRAVFVLRAIQNAQGIVFDEAKLAELPVLSEVEWAEAFANLGGAQTQDAADNPLDVSAASATQQRPVFELHRQQLGDAGATGLAGAWQRGALAGIKALKLRWCSIGSAGCVALAQAPLSSVTELNLHGNAVGDDGAAAAVAPFAVERAAAGFEGLRTLNLWACDVGDAVWTAVLSGGGMRSLSSLTLNRTRVGDRGLRPLSTREGAAGAALPALEDLQLAYCTRVDAGACRALLGFCAGGGMPCLRTLNLNGSPVGDIGLECFAEARVGSALSALTRLDLRSCDCYGNAAVDSAVAALASALQAGAFCSLQHLLVVGHSELAYSRDGKKEDAGSGWAVMGALGYKPDSGNRIRQQTLDAVKKAMGTRKKDSAK